MPHAKSVILAQKKGRSRKAAALAIAAGIPCFGVVAAFGVAPDTLVDKLRVEQIVQDVTLPHLVVVDQHEEQRYVNESLIQRGDTVAALLARLEVDDPEAVAFLRGSRDNRVIGQMLPGRSIRAETTADGSLQRLRYLAPSGDVITI